MRDSSSIIQGSIGIAGECIKWLRDNLGLIPDSESSGECLSSINPTIVLSCSSLESIADSVQDTGGVYFVPAFSGLFAPHWRSDARGKHSEGSMRDNQRKTPSELLGLITGMTHYTTKGHIVRAALESVAYQTREVNIEQDCSYDSNR